MPQRKRNENVGFRMFGQGSQSLNPKPLSPKPLCVDAILGCVRAWRDHAYSPVS